MERDRREILWRDVEELKGGPESDKAIAKSIRAKALEFEREREAYIEAARQLFAPPLPQPPPSPSPSRSPSPSLSPSPTPTTRVAVSAATAATGATGATGATAGGKNATEGKAVVDVGEDDHEWKDRRDRSHHYCEREQKDHHQQGGRRRKPPRSRSQPGRAVGPNGNGRKSVREAREERRLASEEIRTLQHRKADAKVALQAERLSNLEHELELGVLRLERLLDRDRILELLRLTDPNPGAPTSREGEEPAMTGGGNEGDAGGRGGPGFERKRLVGKAEVSEELIVELEERVAQAEERVRRKATDVGAAVAGRLEERARREENSRREEKLARDEVVRLQTALRGKEERLANTVVSYLELRHAMLRAQRVASEARQEAATARARDEEEMRSCKRDTAEKRRSLTERVEKTCEEVAGELRRQIRLREDEAFMLQEQRAEVEELYEARAVRLEAMLEEWKNKHAALRRRFSLETEGFRRDADNIGRRFERIRAGPRGGRPVISSRSGSSARRAVERAMYYGGRGADAGGGDVDGLLERAYR